MDLKLQLLANNDEKTWTLKSKRGNYSIGTIPGCDIELTGISIDVNLKFSFDEYSQVWYVSDLGKRGNLQIDGQPLSDYALQAQSKITVESGVIINLIPDSRPISTNGQSRSNTTTAIYETVAPPVNQTFQQAPSNQRRASSQSNKSKLRKLNWAQYVDECVKNQKSARFNLITGFRHTPWVKSSSETGFNAFDGYILPDFQDDSGHNRSSDTVMFAIQNKLSEMQSEGMDYENTDCCVASLTDAHIVDSKAQSYFGVELFPIVRGKNHKYDYRDFCVVSYNRVATYLLVENYGSDLFVSWITRFEPRTSNIILTIKILIFSTLGLALGSFLQNSFAALLLMVIPAALYFLVPKLMLQIGAVPKAANARFLGVCVGALWMLLITCISSSSGTGSTAPMLNAVGLISMVSYHMIAFFSDRFNPENKDIPPLDLIDAKKLDDAVSNQVESVLKPMLERANYTSDQISQILTRTSLGKIQFRR